MAHRGTSTNETCRGLLKLFEPGVRCHLQLAFHSRDVGALAARRAAPVGLLPGLASMPALLGIEAIWTLSREGLQSRLQSIQIPV